MRLIDADKLKEDINSRFLTAGEKRLLCRIVDKVPTFEERPKSKWIKIFSNPFTDGYICPFCGHKIQVTEQFLPQVTECEVCGADMRGDNDG